MDYTKYRLSPVEWFRVGGEWLAISGVFAYFFYRSVWAFLLLGILLPFYAKYRKKAFLEKRRWKMTLEFKDALMMVSGNLQAGNSVENAFRRSCGELRELYGTKSEIAGEFGVIARGIDNNLTLEHLLLDLAKRTEIEEIEDFGEIFAVAKRTGGNLREIIGDTADTIREKIEIRRELRLVIASKEFEHKIMCLVPFFILAYIGMTNRGYFDVLYHNISGVLIMTVCLMVYLGALYWGNKITAIG